MSIFDLYSQLNLDSRSEQQIPNETDRNLPIPGALLQCGDLKRRYRCIHRDVGPTGKFNCHGLTFASRRTSIANEAVEKILLDDEYKEIQLTNVLAGDIVVYRKEGAVIHSGIVTEGYPNLMVLSKWGALHEVVHYVNNCEYQGEKKYYRIIDEPPKKPGSQPS